MNYLFMINRISQLCLKACFVCNWSRSCLHYSTCRYQVSNECGLVALNTWIIKNWLCLCTSNNILLNLTVACLWHNKFKIIVISYRSWFSLMFEYNKVRHSNQEYVCVCVIYIFNQTKEYKHPWCLSLCSPQNPQTIDAK